MSRNMKPVTFLDAVPSESGTVVQLPDGRQMTDVDMALPESDVERIRQGYVCIRCFEPQSEPFPEICESVLPDGVTRWCNYPIREKQAAEFAVAHKGTVKIGSSVDLEEEVERMTEMDAYEARTGIQLPHSVKFPTTSVRRTS